MSEQVIGGTGGGACAACGQFSDNCRCFTTMYPKEEDDKLRREVLLEAGQACLDWAQDTGACHLCHYDGPAKKPHDDECPLRKLL